MKTLRITIALVALAGVSGTAKADVNSGLQVVLEMMRARNGVTTSCRPSYQRRYYCPDPYPSPLAAPPYVWDRSVSDLSRYHLSTPVWAQPTHQEEIMSHSPEGPQSRFYAPYQSCPPPPRLGYDSPDKVLKSIRGW